MDSTYASGTAINGAHYTVKLSMLSSAVGALQAQLDSLQNDRLTLAAQLLTQNAGIGSTQTWEQNEKLVNELEIRIFIQDSVNATQLTMLDNLGMLCPNTNGEAVLRAQVLYNRFMEKEFSPVCTGVRGGSGEREDEPEKVANFSLFPNSSAGIFTVLGINAFNSQADIFDISGLKVALLGEKGRIIAGKAVMAAK